MRRLPFTFRQLQWPLAVWGLATLAATLTGPFGTFAALEPAPRALYWGAVVAAAVLLHLGFRRIDGLAFGRRLPATLWSVALDAGYALIMGAGVWLLNRALFASWGGPWDYLYLVAIVLAVSVAISVLRWLLAGQGGEASASADPDVSAQARFLRHLPVEKRAPIIRLEAQDHYLLVVTRAARALILMRMRDAEAELAGARGLRVHRSHWVAQDAVRGRRNTDGRATLCMADGAEVPVSRNYRSAARKAGLI